MENTPISVLVQITKSQLLNIIKQVKELAISKLLLMKKNHIQTRLGFYKVDSNAYRSCLHNFNSAKERLIEDLVIQVCYEHNVSPESYYAEIQSNCYDPEINDLLNSLQTISENLSDDLQIPDECDLEKLKEAMKIQIAELLKYPFNGSASELVIISVCDEVYQRLGIDELMYWAMANKFMDSENLEFIDLKDQWNKAAGFE